MHCKRISVAGSIVCALALLPVLRFSAHAGEPAGGTYHLHKGDVVLFLGDSITAETKYYYKIYYDDLAKKQPDLFGKPPSYKESPFVTPGLTFINAGVSGDIAAGGLKRLPDLLAKHKPTVAVVCFGMNDRYKDRKNYDAKMLSIVKKLKEANVAVTLLTSPCVCPLKHPELQPYVATLGEMAEEVRALARAENVGFADCYTPTKNYMDTKKKDFTWGDGIHPNEDGHRIMADVLQAAWGFGKPLAGEGAPRTPAAGPDAETKKTAP